MPVTSFVLAFADLAQLEAEEREHLSLGRARIQGEHALTPGQTCEVVLVHPETGDSVSIDARVEGPADDPAEGRYLDVRFAVTPLVRARLDKLVGTDAEGRGLAARIRKLTGPERRQLALRGTLTERTALERAFGKEVWEHLLDNPNLTVGEVVRLARMGALPVPLLDRIVAHATWTRVPQVRRALLAHPRLEGAAVQKILRLTPADELKLVPAQTAYPAQVRAVARRMLGRG